MRATTLLRASAMFCVGVAECALWYRVDKSITVLAQQLRQKKRSRDKDREVQDMQLPTVHGISRTVPDFLPASRKGPENML